MKLQLLLCALPAALAFSNTAPFYGLDTAHVDLAHLVRSDVLEELSSLPRALCAGGSTKQLLWCRVAGLDFDALPYLAPGLSLARIDAVFYGSAAELEPRLSEFCLDEQLVSSSGALAKVFDQFAVNVVDVDSEAQLSEVTAQFLKLVANPVVWVQGKPAFDAPHQLKLDQVKEMVGDAIGEDLDELDGLFTRSKRSDDESSEDAASEIENDFMAAESYIFAEGDRPVHILDSGDNASESSPSAGGKKKKDVDNLFTNYQFFTPGVLQCLLVSFSLIGVLYVALSWITSLEITYKSFDKQVDYEKKQE